MFISILLQDFYCEIIKKLYFRYNVQTSLILLRLIHNNLMVSVYIETRKDFIIWILFSFIYKPLKMRRDFLHKHTTGFNAGVILKKKSISRSKQLKYSIPTSKKERDTVVPMWLYNSLIWLYHKRTHIDQVNILRVFN